MSVPLLLQALQKKKTGRLPFWLMRQAGRYLPEYRALREKAGSFLALCFHPDYAAEVTLQPLQRFDMDAAILFSDILVVPYALGQKLTFTEGEGPRLSGAIDLQAPFDRAAFDRALEPVYQTVKNVKSGLSPEKALIGFAGSPWTVACYMIQGRGDGVFQSARDKALCNDEAFILLIDRLVESTTHYLLQQIRHGADAVQLFDSWAGLAPPHLFESLVIAPTRRIVADIHAQAPQVPVIGFPRQAGAFYSTYAEKTGISGLGVDQQASLSQVIAACPAVTVQGNLSPETLLAGGLTLEKEIDDILRDVGTAPFIFNLGHGIIKETPIAHVEYLSRRLKEYRR